jgi:enterochelin esterase-like enzyme
MMLRLAFLLFITSLAVSSAAQTPITLDATAVVAQLSAGQSLEYRMPLRAGQFAHVVADQRGVDVSLEVTDPNGVTVDSVDARPQGAEEMSVTAKVAGDYKITIRPVRTDAPAGTVAVWARSARRYVLDRTQVFIVSRRLKALCDEIAVDPRAAVSAFLAERKGKGPIVEPLADDDRCVNITFFFPGDPTTRTVELTGGPVMQGTVYLSRMPFTDLWTTTIIAPKDSRFSYRFKVTSEVSISPGDPGATLRRSASLLDPSNPDVSSVSGSMLVLDGTPKRPYADTPAPDSAKGTVTKSDISSRILKEKRTYAVYTPHGYDSAHPGRYGLLVVFDGEAYTAQIPTANILDNLIAAGKIPPMVALLINAQGTRNRDLTCYQPFVDFLCGELIPAVRSKYPGVTKDPKQIIVAGSSFGGLCSSYCGLVRPDVFGNVLSQSGSYWVGGSDWLKQNQSLPPVEGFVQAGFLSSKRLPVRFFMEVGTYEEASMQLMTNRQLRDILRAKGYDVTYSEFNGNHDYEHWRGSLADGLIVLTRPWR